MSKHFYYHLTICIAATCLCLAPLFISDLQQQIHNISRTGSLGDLLRTSVTIKVSEGITIGSTLPVMMDIFLDKIENISALNLTNTFVAIFVIITSGTLYLSLNDHYFMAYLYISLYGFRMLTITSAILCSISKGVIATRWKMNPWIFLCPIIFMATINILLSLNILFPEYVIIPLLLTLTRLAAALALLAMHGYWFFNLWRHYQTHKQFDLDEKKEMTYMVGDLCYLLFQIVLLSRKQITNWLDVDESTLIAIYAMTVGCSVFMTVLPGRLLRKMSEKIESVLQLKREFVRYVSHEIRSPLNVAHAGLEILKTELEAARVSISILSLLDDIFSASNTAIEILNDMLHYEHIDSGTFKLEMAVIPLLKVFAGRLEAYKYMASKKSITLRIEDLAQVSDYYADPDSAVEGDTDAFCLASPSSFSLLLPASDSDNCDAVSVPLVPVLYIDRFRVEQIIRNLVSNAIKFTPEEGRITLRFVRTAVADTSGVAGLLLPSRDGRLNPIDSVEGDDSLDKRVNGFLRVEVVDSGAGIALENQPKMFNEFTQFNRNTLQGGGGSGLGLWICRNLATLHGGRLHFHSDGEGRGSTFIVELPIYLKQAHSAPDNTTPAQPSISSRPATSSGISIRIVPVEDDGDRLIEDEDIDLEAARNLTILVVDDSSPNRKIVIRMLKSSVNRSVLGDCAILEADDGSTALEIMRSESAAGRAIDMVLMDYVMVHMNGPEAVQLMRTELGYRGLVVGITGNALPEDLDYFRDHGADMVITKPLTNAKLMDAIGHSRGGELRRKKDMHGCYEGDNSTLHSLKGNGK